MLDVETRLISSLHPAYGLLLLSCLFLFKYLNTLEQVLNQYLLLCNDRLLFFNCLDSHHSEIIIGDS